MCNILARHVGCMDGVGQCVTFKHWHSICQSLTTLSDETSSRSSREQTEYCGVHEREGLYFEFFKHEVAEGLLVCFGVGWRVGHEQVHVGALDAKLVGENVFEKLFHSVYVYNDTTLNGFIVIVRGT